MSIAKRSSLRAAVNRRITFEGEYRTSIDSILLDEVNITVISAPKAKPGEAKVAGYKAGTVLEIETVTKVKAFDRILRAKYPPGLYDVGMVSAPGLIDTLDGMATVKCMVTLVKDTALVGLGPVTIYVEGE